MSGALWKTLQRTWSSEVSLDFKEQNPTQISSANFIRQAMVYLSESTEEVHLCLGKQGCSRGLRSSHLWPLFCSFTLLRPAVSGCLCLKVQIIGRENLIGSTWLSHPLPNQWILVKGTTAAETKQLWEDPCGWGAWFPKTMLDRQLSSGLWLFGGQALRCSVYALWRRQTPKAGASE